MINRRSRTSQPPPGVEPVSDPTLRLAINWNRGIPNADALGKSTFLIVGGPEMGARAPGVRGPVLNSGSTQYAYAARSVLGGTVSGSQPFTLAVYALPRDATTRGALITLGNSADDNAYIWLEINQAGDGKASFNTRADNFNSEIITTTNAYTAGQPITAVAVQSGGAARKVVLNGNLTAAGSGATDYSASSWTVNRTAIGALLRSAAIVPMLGVPFLAVAYSRAWSDAEIVEFSRNPWRVFAPAPRRIWPAAAVGGGFNAAWALGSNSVISGARV